MCYRFNLYGVLRCTEGETKARTKGHRLIFDWSHKASDVLLSELDLPPRNHNYVTEIKEEDCKVNSAKVFKKLWLMRWLLD